MKRLAKEACSSYRTLLRLFKINKSITPYKYIEQVKIQKSTQMFLLDGKSNGLFGFEFKPSPKFTYFIELGGVGTGAIADKIADKPIYSNGFLTNVGFRIGI